MVGGGGGRYDGRNHSPPIFPPLLSLKSVVLEVASTCGTTDMGESGVQLQFTCGERVASCKVYRSVLSLHCTTLTRHLSLNVNRNAGWSEIKIRGQKLHFPTERDCTLNQMLPAWS